MKKTIYILLIILSFCSVRNNEITDNSLKFKKLYGSNSNGEKFFFIKNNNTYQLRLKMNEELSYFEGTIIEKNRILQFVPTKKNFSISLCKNRRYGENMIGYFIPDTTNFMNMAGQQILFNLTKDSIIIDTSVIIDKPSIFFRVESEPDEIHACFSHSMYGFGMDTLTYKISTALCIDTKRYFDTLNITILGDEITLVKNTNNRTFSFPKFTIE